MASETYRKTDQWLSGTTAMLKNITNQSENRTSTKPPTPQHVISLIVSPNEDLNQNKTIVMESGHDNARAIYYRINGGNNGTGTNTPRRDTVSKSSTTPIARVMPKDASTSATNHSDRSDNAGAPLVSTHRATSKTMNGSSLTWASSAMSLTPSVTSREIIYRHPNNSVTITTKMNATNTSFPYGDSTHRFTILFVIVCSMLALLLPLVMVVLKKIFNKGTSNIKHRKLKSFPRDLLLASTGFDEAGKGEPGGNKVAQTPFIETGDKQKQAREKLYLAENMRSGGISYKHDIPPTTYRIMSDSNMILGWKNRKTYPSKQRHDCQPVSKDFMFLQSGTDADLRHFSDICTSQPEESASVKNCPLHQTCANEASDNFFHISCNRSAKADNDYQNWTNDHARNPICRCASKSEMLKTCSSTSSGYSTESSMAYKINELFQLSKVYDPHQESLDARKLSLLPLKYTIANQHASDHLGEESETQLVEIPLDSPPTRRKFIDFEENNTCQHDPIKHVPPRREKLFSLTLLNATWSQDEQKSMRARKIISSKPKFPKMGKICLMNQPKPVNASTQNVPPTADELYNNYKSLSSTASSSSSSSKSCNANKSPNTSENPKCQIYASIKDNDYNGGYSQLLRRSKDSEENVYCEIIKIQRDEICLEDEKCADRRGREKTEDFHNKNGEPIDEVNKNSDYVNLPKMKQPDENEIYRNCEAPQKHSFSSKFYRYSFLNNAQYTPLVEKDAEKEAILLETDDEDAEDKHRGDEVPTTST